jgi:hypothetical protein
MTQMQNHFVTRDSANRWDAGLNPPNPRMSVMAMDDGFTIHSGAFGDSVPMTNYTESELGIPATNNRAAEEKFAAEDTETVTETGDGIPGNYIEPIKPGFFEILARFNDWVKDNVGYTIIGIGVVAGIYWAGARSNK